MDERNPTYDRLWLVYLPGDNLWEECETYEEAIERARSVANLGAGP